MENGKPGYPKRSGGGGGCKVFSSRKKTMRWRGVEIDRHCLERDARAWRHGVWLVEALRDGGRRLEGLQFK